MERSQASFTLPVTRTPTYSPSTPIELDAREYSMEYDKTKQMTESIRPVDSPYSEEEDLTRQPEDLQWKPGFFNQFPTLGFGALFVALLCAAASVVTLYISDAYSAKKWPEKLAPNVIIGGLNSVANICYGIAIANGIAIAWWRQALKGATIKQLHKSWSFSSSLKSVMLAGKYFNVIALAALTTKLTIIDNMLMQRATSTTNYLDGPFYYNNFTMYANDTIPNTGTVQGRSGLTKILDTNLNADLIIWEANGGQVAAHGDGNQGLYFMNVSAAGFSFECSEPMVTPINYAEETMNATMYASEHNGSTDGSKNEFTPTLFSLDFEAQSTGTVNDDGSPAAGAYSWIQMNVTWTAANDTADNECPGVKTVQSCKLRPAVVEYPVLVQNTSSPDEHVYTTATSFFTSTLLTFETESDYASFSDSPTTFGVYNSSLNQVNGFNVQSYKDIFDDSVFYGAGSTSALGGLVEAFTEYLAGNASISFSTLGFDVTQTGNAQKWLEQTPNSTNGCGYQYIDPVTVDIWSTTWYMNSVLMSINQIMFTIATDPYYESDSHFDADFNRIVPLDRRNAVLYRDTVFYVTHYRFLWAAFASMLLCTLLILPSYYGYWQLGRKVSLGPFEIAHAFRSPLTAAGSNGSIDELIKEVGHNPVKYGQITKGDARGVLGIAEPENVARVHPKVGSAKGEINEKLQGTFGRAVTQ